MLTEEEKANGWTEESLEKYRKERERAQMEAIMNPLPKRPKWANNQYDPKRWR